MENDKKLYLAEKVIIRGSKSLRLTVGVDGVAKGTVQNNTGLPKVPGETSLLYEEAFAILQSMSDRKQIEIIKKFGTVHPKMKIWMRNNSDRFGFTITEDEIDGRTLKAEKIFKPRHSR